MDELRFRRALAAIDARNAGDPNTLRVGGLERPKELAHAELVTAWVRRLVQHPSEPLLLAARAHHIRRWTIPRNSRPEGRAGYLDWRRALLDMHAAELRAILDREGYPPNTVSRAEHILRKRNLSSDPEAQALEDALCLTFLETQFLDLAARLGEEKMIEVLRKAARKMSPAGLALALGIDLPDAARALLGRATAPGPPPGRTGERR